MHCNNCGCYIEDGSNVCPNCGEHLQLTKKSGGSGFGWGVLGFFFPIVGLILFLVWRKEKRTRAKASGIGALIGEILKVITAIFLAVILVLLAGFGYLLGQGNGDDDGDDDGDGNSFSYMDPWFRNPDNWQTPNGQYPYNQPSDPSYATFVNSPDGVLSFGKVKSGHMLYDVDTNQIIVYSMWALTIYDADSGEQTYAKTYNLPMQCASAYGGKLAMGFGNCEQFRILDLQSYQEDIYYTNISVSEIALTDGAVVYVDDDQWCTITLYNFEDGSEYVISTNYHEPAIAINHQDNMLYIVERNLSSCVFALFNLSTYEEIQATQFGEYEYNRGNVFYDGTYVHVFGNLYHATTGHMVAIGQTLHFDTVLNMYSILCVDNGKALVTTSDCQTAVCDIKSRQVLYTMDLYATRIYAIGGGKYVALCGETGYYAFINLNKVA